jgi:hypothetical protein
VLENEEDSVVLLELVKLGEGETVTLPVELGVLLEEGGSGAKLIKKPDLTVLESETKEKVKLLPDTGRSEVRSPENRW